LQLLSSLYYGAFLFVWGEAEYSVSEKYVRCKFSCFFRATEKCN
jgi:hypothetical protein